MKKPRVLICDDHALIIEGLRSILANNFDVVGVCENGRDLIAQTEQMQPDAVLVDVSLPVLNGIEAARRIKTIAPNIKIVFVTQRSDPEYVQTAFRVGASAYILKQSAAGEVIPALREALAGKYYVTPTLFSGTPAALTSPYRNPAELFGGKLTGRQREVLQLVAEGKSNKEIAGVLNISLKTVDFHKARIMDELRLRSTAELTRYAIEHGMVGA